MKWFNEQWQIEGKEFDVSGTFDGHTVQILLNEQVMFTKTLSSLTFTDITNEDIYGKYAPKIIKIKERIPDWIKAGKF